MKSIVKLISVLLTTAFLLTFNLVPALASQNTVVFTINSNHYTINGQSYSMDVAPVIQNGRTLIPLRYLANSLGISNDNISWNAEAKQVTFTLSNGDNVLATIGDEKLYYYSSGITSVIQMDTTPVIINSRVYLPARYFAQVLGYTVSWDSQDQEVIITNQSTDTNQTSSMLTYKDTINNVTFSYPSGLTEEVSADGSATFGNEDFFVSYDAVPTDGKSFSFSQTEQDIQQSLTDQGTTNINFISTANTTIDSLPGYEINFKATNTHGVEAEFSVYCVEYNNNLIVWVFGVRKDACNNYAQTITDMLNSININTPNTNNNNSMLTYKDTINNVTFSYPSGLTEEVSADGSATFENEDFFVFYDVVPADGESFSFSQTEQNIQQSLTDQGATNINFISTANTTIDSLPGYEINFTATNPDGIEAEFSVYCVEYNNNLIGWIFGVRKDAYSNYAQTITDMLNSININASSTSTNNTSSSAYQTFIDSNNNVSFQYPATWTKVEDTANPDNYGAGFFNPSDKEVTITYIAMQLGQASDESAQLLEQQLIGKILAGAEFSNVNIISTNPVTIGNVNGCETKLTATIGGVNEILDIYMVVKNGVGLVWIYEGSVDGYANNQQIITNLLNSVKLN